MRKLRVIVKEIFKEDEGKGIVRLDPEVMESLNLKMGDAIEIAHSTISNKTAALVFPGIKDDRKTNIIRMDKFSIRNLNVELDDLVKVNKIKDEFAEDITFMGLIKPAKLKTSQQLTRKLENRVFTMNDVLSINAFGRKIELIIVDYTPKADAVRIYLDTKIIAIANKQDLPDALSAKKVQKKLGLRTYGMSAIRLDLKDRIREILEYEMETK